MAMQEEKVLDERPDRPVLLSVLSILSFIVLIPILVLLFCIILRPEAVIAAIGNAGIEADLLNREIVILTSTAGFVIAGLILWGIILMYLMKKGGFIMFVIPFGVILIIELAVTIVNGEIFPGILAFLSICMITGFALMLRSMKNHHHV